MLLNDGVCTLLKRVDTSAKGEKPKYELKPIFDAWFGELSHLREPLFNTELREDVRVDRKIRILRTQADDLYGVLIDGKTYKAVRTYFGVEDESGERIIDLSLQRVEEHDEQCACVV